MDQKRRFAIPMCALVLGGMMAGAIQAGEVKGPPGTPNNTNATGAPEHSNSACSYSGLNDLDSSEGQNERHVQTAADSWKFYGLIRGFPGRAGACRGGTNESRGEE